ncbi:MAG: hypothetical protein ACLQVX_03930 [Limisphaerales bacterium]
MRPEQLPGILVAQYANGWLAEEWFGDGMRKQYHIRDSERGLLAWDVDRLLRLTAEQEPVDLPLERIRELDEAFWFSGDGNTPTCRRVAEHAKLINQTSLDHPIIIDPEGRVMDGMHRVCKALISGLKIIKAVKLSVMPEPDFVGVPIDELPYKRADCTQRTARLRRACAPRQRRGAADAER